MALKKQPRTKLFGLFGDTPPNEQGQFKDKHSLNFIWENVLLQFLHTMTSGDLPDLGGFHKGPIWEWRRP